MGPSDPIFLRIILRMDATVHGRLFCRFFIFIAAFHFGLMCFGKFEWLNVVTNLDFEIRWILQWQSHSATMAQLCKARCNKRFAQYIKPGLVQERDTVESAGGFRL